MKKIDYIVSVGQDCSTLLFIKNASNHVKWFFDGFAVYSDDYLKFLDQKFLIKAKDNIQVYCKSPFNSILDLFHKLQEWDKKDKLRLDFHAICGNKYDVAYIDVVHIDNNVVYDLLFSTDLEQFLKNIQDKAIPYVCKLVKENIEKSLNLLNKKNLNKKILFVRTIKHFMHPNEILGLRSGNIILSKIFKNSKFLAITDVKENLKYNLDFVKYLKFDHWIESSKSINEFNKIVNNF